uniref:hypothetical protein n=1 Tax=Vibrio alfacsensis TaxID=1074311 RepID=UPI0013E33740|nr:hypothetical protein [Vibrio alfacsensis]
MIIRSHSIQYGITSLFNNNYHEDLTAELVGHSIGKRMTGKVSNSICNSAGESYRVDI